jgi:hypothetical protein
MKDIVTIFNERLDNMISNLQTGNYSVCFNIAHDLVNLAWNLELKDEVFVSEVLESIFSNLRSTIENYDVPADKAKELREQMVKLMQPIKDAYKSKNPTLLYNALRELRYCATHNQFNAWQKYDKPNKREYFLGGRE